jgi:hypothetical protein
MSHTKQIFTKTQAVSVLVQLKAGQDLDIMKPVDMKHALFKSSCDELEKRLLQYMSPEGIAGVVEDTVTPSQ